jgi:hypothetical protein
LARIEPVTVSTLHGNSEHVEFKLPAPLTQAKRGLASA